MYWKALRGSETLLKNFLPNQSENTVKTEGGGQKNQKKNKKSLTGEAWRCITRSRRCGTECLAEPGGAERPGTAGRKSFLKKAEESG